MISHTNVCVFGLYVHDALWYARQLAPDAPSPKYSSTSTFSIVRVVRRELRVTSIVPPCSSIWTIGRNAMGIELCATALAVAGV